MQKQYFFRISIFLLCTYTLLPMMLKGQEGAPFSMRFTDGTVFVVRQVAICDEPFETWKGNTNPLKDMFYKYNFPDDVNQYKSLFYQGGFPAGIDNIYTTWRAQMNAIRIFPEVIFYGTLDNEPVACIQYSFTEDDARMQMSFLAKQVSEQWYPIGGAAMAHYQHVMGLFAVLHGELAACIIHPNTMSAYNDPAQQLITTCSTGDHVLQESCLYGLTEKWGTSSQKTDQSREAEVFKKRWYRENEQPSTGDTRLTSLRTYLAQQDLPDEAIRRAMYYFSKNEAMKAISVLQENGLQEDLQKLFKDLNTILETHQYRLIEVASKENTQNK